MCNVTDVIMAGALGGAAMKDIKKKEVSMNLLIVLTVFSVATAFLYRKNPREILFGAGIGAGFFLVSKCTRQQIGYGDSWLILVLGIYAGANNLVWMLFAASFGAGIFSLIVCTFRGWNRKYSIPFVPFLAAAFVGVMIL